MRVYTFLYVIHERGYLHFTLNHCLRYLARFGIPSPGLHGSNIRHKPFGQLFSDSNSVIKVEWNNSIVSHYCYDEDNLEKYMMLLQRILINKED
jgi:hypothetical protein